MMLHTKQAVLTMCIHTYADTLHYEIAILAAIDASQVSQLLFNGPIEEYLTHYKYLNDFKTIKKVAYQDKR